MGLSDRRSQVLGLLAVAAVCVSLSVFLSWDRVIGVPTGDGFAVGYGTNGIPSGLVWHGLRPPTVLRLLMVLSAWVLVLLALRRPRTAALCAAPAAIAFAGLVAVGSPATQTLAGPSSEIHVAPGAGVFVATVALVAVLISAARIARTAEPSQ